MKSLSKLGKTIMKVANINLNFRKMKNNDKKAATPPSRHTSTLKAVPLALLLAMNTGNISAGSDLKSVDPNPTDAKIEMVSKPVSVPQSEERISPEDSKTLGFLRSMCFGKPKEQINLVNNDEKLICILKGIQDKNTKEHLGDALFILYYLPENKKNFDELKNAGKNPKPEYYPVEKAYLIPINVFDGHTKLENDLFASCMGEEKDYNITTDFYSFKCEAYPELLCEFRIPDLAVRLKLLSPQTFSIIPSNVNCSS